MPDPRLLLLFFVSGACGLIYQVVWMRALTLTLSVSVYAVTTVLVAFMSGLALGAAIAGRVADRLDRPLLAFGLAELGVGLAGLVSLAILFDLGPAYAWLHEVLGGAGLAFTIARFLLACVVLIVPTTLMGMTLPLLSRAVVSSKAEVGRGAGGLYAVNTLGAFAGCIVAGFVLIPATGLNSTTSIAAALNIAIGASAVWLGRGERGLLVAAAGRAPSRVRMPRMALIAALAFAVSGFTAIGYEVLWTRALEQFTHNSTYAYTAMLAVFLLGIGGGGALAAPLADRVKRPLAALAALEIGIGLSVVAGLLVYRRLLHWIPAATQALGEIDSWSAALVLMFGVAAVTLLVTALLFGATFPFVARAVVDDVERVGGRIATAYSLNTVGSILGAVAVGFFMLPAIGMRGSFVTLIHLNLALGVAVMWLGAPRIATAAAAGLALAGVAVTLAAIPSQLFRDIYLERYGKLLMYREQITDIVMVTEDDRGRLIRYGDGRGTAGTITVKEDRSYAHVAMLPHPNPKRVLNICFGVGNSLSAVAQYPVERIDQVELSPGVVHAAPFFRSTNRDVLEDPRVHLTIQDGRNYLLASRDRFDVIRLDPPELHTAGIVNLYTREFFELARDHLAPGGIFSIWVNIAYTPEPELKMILQTARTVFPHVSVWHSPWLYSWTINGSVEPRPPDMELLLRHFANPRVKADLESINIGDPFEFLDYFVMAGDEVAEYVGDAPIITDDRTRIDFSVARSEQSFFGITNSISDYYLLEQTKARSAVLRHALLMCRHKQNVLPHLVNPGASGLTREALQRRLEAVRASRPLKCVGASAPTPRGSN